MHADADDEYDDLDDDEPRFGAAQATAREIVDVLFGERDKPEKKPASQTRAEKKKERPPMQLPSGKYLTVEDVDARITEVADEIDHAEYGSEEYERADDEQAALYRKRFSLEQGAASAQSETRKEINRLKGLDKELQARENQEGITAAVKLETLAERQLARQRAEALERRLPYLGRSDEELGLAVETAKISHEELTEKANALPAESARRAKAQREADEARGRYLHIEAEVLQRKRDVSFQAARTVRFTSVAERELRAEAQQRVNELVASGTAEAWEIEKAKLEASQPLTKEQIAAKVPAVAAVIDARVEQMAKEILMDRPFGS